MKEQFFITFNKFKSSPDFDFHLKKIRDLGKNRVLGEIKIDQSTTMPRYGPDPKIFEYETQLKNWDQSDIEDFVFLRDLYFQGAVDDLRFCRLSAAHLSSLPEYKDNQALTKVYYILEEEKDPDPDLIGELAMSEDEQISTLGASLMMTFYT